MQYLSNVKVDKLSTSYSSFLNVLAFIFLSTLGWGTSFLCIKISLEECISLEVVFWRLFVGFIVLELLSRATKIENSSSRVDFFHYCMVGLLSFFIPFFLIACAERSLDSGITGLLNALTPVATLLLSSFSAIHRKTNKYYYGISAVLGISGLSLVMIKGFSTHVLNDIWASSQVSLACISYACGSLYKTRFLSHKNAFLITKFALLSSSFLSFMFLFIVYQEIKIPIKFDTCMSLLWLGIISTGLSFLLYFHLIKKWGAFKTSMVSYTFPLSSYLLGILFLEENFSITVLFGGLLIILATLLTHGEQLNGLSKLWMAQKLHKRDNI